jgi:divalent metal cation (Fe/Co/Zn/Cd) transporter
MLDNLPLLGITNSSATDFSTSYVTLSGIIGIVMIHFCLIMSLAIFIYICKRPSESMKQAVKRFLKS